MPSRAPDPSRQSRRERQIMDAIYHLGEAGALDVAHHLDDEAGYHSIRVTLGILERKGFLKHRMDGNRNIYYPVVSRDSASRKAVRHLLGTFFSGSPSQAFVALLDASGDQLTRAELRRIADAIEDARKEGR